MSTIFIYHILQDEKGKMKKKGVKGTPCIIGEVDSDILGFSQGEFSYNSFPFIYLIVLHISLLQIAYAVLPVQLIHL